jgi:isoleucyl-tRNA synthetase
MGHALNKVLKDIVVKYRNMGGWHTEYRPGYDCHGLPIEQAAAKALKGVTDSKVLRDKCRAHAEKFVQIMSEEFKRLAVFGQWDDVYRTMDPAYEADTIRELANVVDAGVLVKRNKPVYWSIPFRTALAEAEVEYKDHVSPSITVAFPLEGGTVDGGTLPEGTCIAIWTTTPWTLLANEAVGVNPEFTYVLARVGDQHLILAEELYERFTGTQGDDVTAEKVRSFSGKALEGLRYTMPLIAAEPLSDHWNSNKDTVWTVVCGDHVTLEAGTGCVHTAPGHGQDDYEIGLATGLPIYNPVLPNGTYDDSVPESFRGMKVTEANAVVLDRLKELGILLHHEDYTHSYPHCWRSKTPVIFRATEQWFIAMDSEYGLRERTLKEIEGVRWIPDWGQNRISGMIASRPDWCISRQRQWGVPIPFFYCASCRHPLIDSALIRNVADDVESGGLEAWWDQPAEKWVSECKCDSCGHTSFDKETDILDVWFDSGVSYSAAMKSDDKIDLYLEGSDQHRGWFHTAMLHSVVTRGRAPYREVLTHGFVTDGKGRKMSKSLGNVTAPQDVIKRLGAEILRLWISSVDFSGDIHYSQEIVTRVQEAYRKIRNTCRFFLGNLSDFNPDTDAVDPKDMPEIDLFGLQLLRELEEKVLHAYQNYDFHLVYQKIHEVCSVDMSSFYLDIAKDRLYCDATEGLSRRSAQTVCAHALESLVRLMAPVLSFTAEEIWQNLAWKKTDSVFLADMPGVEEAHLSAEQLERWRDLRKLRSGVTRVLEGARAEKVIGHSLDANVVLHVGNDNARTLLESLGDLLADFFIVSNAEVSTEAGGTPVEDFDGLSVAVTRASVEKCPRCWKYKTEVAERSVCNRCEQALK